MGRLKDWFSRLGERKLIVVGSLLALALILRLLAISSRPFWYDEAFSALFASSGPQAMLGGTLDGRAGSAAEEHPLLYYTLLWGWMRALGESPGVVRGLSVLAGLGVVTLAYLLGRSLFDDKFGLLAGGIVALAPFQIHYAQEARMYALMAFWLLGATYALWRGMRTRRWSWWLGFMLCAALAQYTHNLSAFFLLPLALTPLLARDWRSARAVVFGGLGALLLYTPWLLRLPAQFAKIQGNFWLTHPAPARLMTTLLSFITNLPLPGLWLGAGLFITLMLTALGSWQTLRAWRVHRAGVRRGLWLGYLAAAPVLLLYLFSQWTPVFVERALLPAGVLFLLWLAWAFTRTKLPALVQRIAAALLLLGFGLGISIHLSYDGFPYAPYAGLDASLAGRVAPGEVILHSNKLTFLPMDYYDRSLPQRFMADPPESASDTLAPATQAVMGIQADADIAQAVAAAPRIWFVIFERAIAEYQTAGAAEHPHLGWLDAHYRRERVENWGELQVYVYVEK